MSDIDGADTAHPNFEGFIPWKEWLAQHQKEDGTADSVFVEHNRRLQPCQGWLRDVQRSLLVVVGVIQMFYFGYYYHCFRVEHPAATTDLTPMWTTSGAVIIVVFLILITYPNAYLVTVLVQLESFWQFGTLALYTPLGLSSSQIWYNELEGASYVPYYGAWVTYVVVAILPMLGWMIFASVPNLYGTLVPDGFFPLSLSVNMIINVAYLYKIDDSRRDDPFEVVYLLLNATKKSVLEVLDLEAITNSLGLLQQKTDVAVYLTWSFLIFMAVCIHLSMTTLEVHLKHRKIWNISGLTRLLTADAGITNRYARATLLFLMIHLTLSLLADTFIFVLRLVFAIHYGPVSPFIYKNIFYIVVHGCHMYTLMVLLYQAKSLKAAASELAPVTGDPQAPGEIIDDPEAAFLEINDPEFPFFTGDQPEALGKDISDIEIKIPTPPAPSPEWPRSVTPENLEFELEN